MKFDKLYLKNIRNELVELYLQNMEKSIELIDVIIPAITRFEGKIYSKRFDYAVNRVILKHYNNDKSKTVGFGSYIASEHITLAFYFANNRWLEDSNSGQRYYFPHGYDRVELLRQYSDKPGHLTRYVRYDENYNLHLHASLIAEALEEQKRELQKKINNFRAELHNNNIPDEIRELLSDNYLDYLCRISKTGEIDEI